MPYQSIADLPKAQTDQYNEHQKRAFLEAFNRGDVTDEHATRDEPVVQIGSLHSSSRCANQLLTRTSGGSGG